MYVSEEELAVPGVSEGLHNWMRNMQKIAKHNSPVFALKGPVVLPVRKRHHALPSIRGTVASALGSHPFLGDEKLRLTGVYTEEDRVNRGKLMGATLVPVSIGMTATISGLSLPLSECILHLEGFEEWTKEPSVASLTAVKKEKPKPASREENPMWGMW